MEKDDLRVVPLVAYESMLAREDRQQKRMVVVIIILIVLFAISNALWLFLWNSYDYVDEYSVEASQDGEGINIAGVGVNYGAGSENNDNTQENS